MRTARLSRQTRETEISATLALDGTGRATISTGVGFFDHMLDQIARHSLIDLDVQAKGDLHIDQHHTVEDTGIVLGQAFRQALGDMRGITRYADVLLPTVQRIIAAGADRFDASYLTTVGSDAAQPLSGETLTRIDDYGTPDPANAAYESGIFRLGDRLLAINRPAQEDNLEILSRESLDDALEGTGYTLLDQAGQANDPSLSRDVWRAFLIAVLFFLISEAILCLPKKSHPQVLPSKAIA